jgi:hypothetical protein
MWIVSSSSLVRLNPSYMSLTQLKIDEDTFLTGSEDGFVRAFSLKPNKLLRVIGQHEED